jgi:hypothetical protein
MTTTEARKARTNAIKAVTGGRWAATSVRTTGTAGALVTKVQTFSTDTEAVAEALTAAGFTITGRKDIGAGMINLFV